MADQNKPKIDLKARLGRKTVGEAGPSIPPPLATGASIPAPPFSSTPPAAQRPQGQSVPGYPGHSGQGGFGQSYPPAGFTPSTAPQAPVMAAPAAIKIEMGEEVIAAQKKGRSKVMMIAAGTAVVGMIIGYAIGGGSERRTRQNIALQGAELLSEEVDKANAETEKLAKILEDAKRALSDGKYPEEEIKQLGDVTIPFDGTYLVGKGTGLMSADINRMLVDFAGSAQKANEQKDRLQRVLGGARSAITEMLSQKEKPKFNWSVFVVNGPQGPMAAMQPVPEPFLVSSKEKVKDAKGNMVDYKWPDEFEVPDGDKKVKLERYQKGNPISNDPQFIPVDPDTQGMVCASDTMVLLRKEIVNLEELLKGDKSDPTNEKMGLIDTGGRLIDKLKGIGH